MAHLAEKARTKTSIAGNKENEHLSMVNHQYKIVTTQVQSSKVHGSRLRSDED